MGKQESEKFCTACGAVLPKVAAFCSGCGARQADADAMPPPVSGPAQATAAAAPVVEPNKTAQGCLGCLGMLFLLFFGCAGLVSLAPKPAPGTEDITAEAVTAAEFGVRRYLKSPDSAKFPSLLWDRSAWVVTRTGPTTARVTAYVDSQNSFGAMLRSRFTAHVQKAGDRWQATSVELER